TASFSIGGASALSGGHNQGSIYDSGTVTITANGFNAVANFNSTSTASSIATALASAFGSSGTVSATASGGTVSLASRSTGVATNYSVTTSRTYNSTYFAQTSFST